MNSNFDLPVSLLIKASRDEVFKAWINPSSACEWLCDDFEGSWTQGDKLYWVFGIERQEIRVSDVNVGHSLAFQWNANQTEAVTSVMIEFKDQGKMTAIKLKEGSWPLTHEAVKTALDHACGWENILCRLKAWIEAGVKLR